MANVDIFSELYAKRISPLDFNWDTLVAPPLLSLLTPQDIYYLNQIAISNRLASKPEEKYKMIDNILSTRGFKKMASGTNRVVYKYLEDQRYCLKVAFDRVGLKDNPQEFQNQFKLKPFVARTFEVSPCGTVALVERVEPITTREEYLHIIDDVFNLLVEKIIGKYVVDDIGTKFFQNIGIRKFMGPVLLDYPYVYDLDGSKMYCNRIDPITNEYCLGEIDYDDGFNYLVCSKCGKQYQARQLAKQVEDRSIVIGKKGVSRAMSIVLMRGDEVVEVISTEKESNTTAKEAPKKEVSGVKVLNKKNFDQRQAKAVKKEENRVKAVKEARKRREENLSKEIDNAFVATEEEPKKEVEVVTVDAAEAAANANPSYTETSRFPREEVEAGTPDVDEYVERIHSESVREEVETGAPFEEEEIQPTIVESKVEEDLDEEDDYVSKEELDESSWDKPCEINKMVIDIDDDVSANY